MGVLGQFSEQYFRGFFTRPIPVCVVVIYIECSFEIRVSAQGLHLKLSKLGSCLWKRK